MDQPDLLAAARAEAARMAAAIERADPGSEVRMPVAQFGMLAALLAGLVQHAEQAATAGAGGREPGDPGDPRYWVPLAHYVALKARHDALHRLAACDALGFASLAAPTLAPTPPIPRAA